METSVESSVESRRSRRRTARCSEASQASSGSGTSFERPSTAQRARASDARHIGRWRSHADRPDRRAWHRALAATGPDAQVAADLVLTARAARRRGGFHAEALALERAARPSTTPSLAGRRYSPLRRQSSSPAGTRTRRRCWTVPPRPIRRTRARGRHRLRTSPAGPLARRGRQSRPAGGRSTGGRSRPGARRQAALLPDRGTVVGLRRPCAGRSCRRGLVADERASGAAGCRVQGGAGLARLWRHGPGRRTGR